MSQNPREAAVVALYKIENEGAYSAQSIIDAAKNLKPIDRSFMNEIAMGVVRNKMYLDFLIQSFSKIKLKKISPWVLQILRTGIYQIVFMDKIPHSAACNEAVKLASRYSNSGAKGFVNGVMRSISRSIENLPEPDGTKREEYLSVKYSSPLWLVKKLMAQYGEEECIKILKDSLLPHPTMIRVNATKTTPDKLADILKNEGIETYKSKDEPCCLLVDGAININNSKAYKDGLYTLQNMNSMRAVSVLDPKEGETVIDVCAAPGGKTTFIAEKMGDTGKVIAMDVHSHKIDLINKTAKRLSLSSIEALVHNSEKTKDEYIEFADRVLADVPCSGIGVIHKKPDIKWNRKEKDIEELCEIQANILKSSSKYVKTGGILVYSTCTILKEENMDIVNQFLANNADFEKVFEKVYLAHETQGSGFYICKLKRKT